MNSSTGFAATIGRGKMKKPKKIAVPKGKAAMMPPGKKAMPPAFMKKKRGKG